MAKILSIVVSTLLSSALADTLSPTISPTKLPTPRPTSFPSPSPTYAPQPLSCSGGVAPAENIEYRYDNPTCADGPSQPTVWGTLEAVYSADCRSSCWANFRDLSLELVANTTDSDFVLQNVYQGHKCTGDLVSTANVDMAEYCGLWTGDCISGKWFGADVENSSFNIPTGLPNGFAMPPACVNWIMNARSSTPQPTTCGGGVAPAANIEYQYDNPTCADGPSQPTVWGTFEAVYSDNCVSSCWGNFDQSPRGLTEISVEVVANTTDSNFVVQNIYDGKNCAGVSISTANVDMADYCGLWTGGCISGKWFAADLENVSFSIPTGFPNGFTMPPVCFDSIMNARSTTGSSKVIVINAANDTNTTTNTTTATSTTTVYTKSFTMTLNGNLDTLSDEQQIVLIASLKSAIIALLNAAGVTIDGDVVVTLSSGSIVAAVVFDTKGSQTDGVTTLTNSLSTTPPTVSDGTNTYTVQSVSSVKSTNNDPSNSATTVRTLGSLIAALLVITTLVL